MAHITIPEAEALLDQEIKVLDKGFVRLVDYLGGDARIVQAARVSYGAGTKTVREDRALIHYLMRHRHTSPFEQVILTFHVKLPIFVARQWIRHRTARLNEMSGRYSVMKDEFYLPDPEQIRPQSKTNKQGRDADALDAEQARRVLEILTSAQETAYAGYREMIDLDIARELARVNLPLSLYTEWYWQIDLHNLFHFIQLRADEHAQYEIRVYAEVLGDCARAVAPLAYEAFEEYVRHARQFSREEMEALRAMLAGQPCPIEQGRRRVEFFQKLGLDDPALQPQEA
ncbi:MAG TPA: FAD-dependent thymidylate synthase [Candidatus Sumerlaeota bacterium]|nr:MAG: Thymidylate synthase ThyX [candidate division BRC1 bacterium ADurb.BinA292]HOE95916.1 FAD-dependent thymidylate synthase [Candidatus Sumerlaeota bacterium]HOR28163.1 FAD-dependent thymidylate synthase [Candidatus Sumerlaeota bacterium]